MSSDTPFPEAREFADAMGFAVSEDWLQGFATARALAMVRADSAVPSSHVSDHPSALSDRAGGEGVQAPDGTTERDAARYRWLRGIGREQVNVMAHYAEQSLDAEIDKAMREAVCAEPAPTTASAPANSETDQPKASKESILREALARLVELRDLKIAALLLNTSGSPSATLSRRHMLEHYERRKGPAWEAARSALAGIPK